MVEVVYSGGTEGTTLEAWRAGPAAFDLNGQPLADRGSTDPIVLPKGSTMTLTLDLSPYIETKAAFQLNLAGADDASGKKVSVFTAAPEGMDFMTVDAAALDDYVVLLQTNQGDIMLEFWPELAPNHVRNFLDLCQTGFYEGILFHRTSPTFMIQGGCPNTKTDRKNAWGSGNGPRMVDAEFSDKKHVRGILSMARSSSPNSASSQFFLMTADSFFLDGKYSAFGKITSGLDVIDRIAGAPGRRGSDGTARPNDPQRIEKAFVFFSPSE
jgi:peptidyl-prolyl cis-trans isomerase B (cyclophilin B)